MSGVIHRKDLDRVMGWLAQILGVGPGLGDVRFLVEDASEYHDWLKYLGVKNDHIHTTVVAAEDALTADRNDVLCVTPGDYAVTSAIAWDKDQTHIVGLGGPNQRQQPSTLTNGGTRIKCITTAVEEVIAVTGNYVQFHRTGFMNNAANTGNKYDVLVQCRNFYAELCAFRGGNNTTQNQNASAGIPLGIGAGYAARFKRCQIGQSGNVTRTTGPGFVKFVAGGHGGIDWEDCIFEMRSETSGANPSGFLVEQTSLDRVMWFKRCLFYNFSENWGALPDYLFNIDQTTTFDILLTQCAMAGFDIVSDNAHVKTIDPAPNSAGCESVAVATS